MKAKLQDGDEYCYLPSSNFKCHNCRAMWLNPGVRRTARRRFWRRERKRVRREVWEEAA